MPTWEFLLQKKGDKSWLPLESPTLEILEGEYRLAAKTSLDNASIDINIECLPSDGETDPWQRRLTRVVNSQGLVLIAPFLNFTSGSWQFNCTVVASDKLPEVKSLSIEVLGAIADSWEGFDLVTDNLFASELLPKVEIPTLEIPKVEILENGNCAKTAALPTQLITLYESEFIIRGGEALEIMGEAYLSGDIEIMLTNDCGDIIQTEYAHDSSDSDFYSYIITIPEQAEAQKFTGQVRISPHEPLQGDYITSQALRIDCQAIFNSLRKFPVLPFENLPAHVPIKRNIKFPELPEFLTGRKNKSQPALPTPKKPIPNWQISNPFKIPSYLDHSDLRYEFE